MRRLFGWIYATTAVIIVVTFWLSGATVEDFALPLTCSIFIAIALTANFLITHGQSQQERWIGHVIWFTGLTVFALIAADWLWKVNTTQNTQGSAYHAMSLINLLFIVTAMSGFIVGRWWGEFYGALSFLIVPVLSFFGTIIPIAVNFETMFGLIFTFILSLFLVSLESMLLRWQRSKVVQIDPSLLFRYCLRLTIWVSAFVLTVGLLLIPPATLIQTPFISKILGLQSVKSFVQLFGSRVSFSKDLIMLGGPIDLPNIVIFQVDGTTYPRWRVHSYIEYTRYGWRVGVLPKHFHRPTAKQSTKNVTKFLFSRHNLRHSLIQETIKATIYPDRELMYTLPIPGSLLQLEVPSKNFSFSFTYDGLVHTTQNHRIPFYKVIALPIPESLSPKNFDRPLDQRQKQAMLEFPSYCWRIKLLAQTITTSLKKPYEKAKALESFLTRHYRYSDTPPVVPFDRRDVTEYFLFEVKEGACDWFASALALMCRAVGIPSRVVTGFYSTEVTPEKKLIVRASGAHAWVEAYIEGHGWVTLDATPITERERRSSFWDNFIKRLKYFLRRSRIYFVNPRITWGIVAILWMLALLPMAMQMSRQAFERNRSMSPSQFVIDRYKKAIELAKAIDLPFDHHATPWENAKRCENLERFPEIVKQAFSILADLTVSIVYAQQETTQQIKCQSEEAWRQFRCAVKDYSRRFGSPKPVWHRFGNWLKNL